MKILITGSTGLIGSALVNYLSREDHKVFRLARSKNVSAALTWNPDEGHINKSAFDDIDIVIHLAGRNVAKGRWNNKRKLQIMTSRVSGTKLLADTLASLESKPKLLITASGVGFYGNRGEEILEENKRKGDGFIAEVCHEWEQAAASASQAGIRVVNLRLGMTLSKKGGALGIMLPIFSLGLGGNIGNGKQYVSWITIEDVCSAVKHIINTESVKGPVNIVTPNPVTNSEFTKALARKLKRPAFIPFPAFLAKLVLGSLAEELLLASTRVAPNKLLSSGFEFRFPVLEAALDNTLPVKK